MVTLSKNNILLADLIDPDLPPAIANQPMMVGWKVLIGLLVIAAFYALVKCLVRYREEKYRQDAIRSLNKFAGGESFSSRDAVIATRQWNRVLKHVACHAYPKHNIAGLTGEAWLAFLKKSADTVDGDKDLLRRWQRGLYLPDNSSKWDKHEADTLYLYCRNWLRAHERG